MKEWMHLFIDFHVFSSYVWIFRLILLTFILYNLQVKRKECDRNKKKRSIITYDDRFNTIHVYIQYWLDEVVVFIKMLVWFPLDIESLVS
jgi:hypothetical protein